MTVRVVLKNVKKSEKVIKNRTYVNTTYNKK